MFVEQNIWGIDYGSKLAGTTVVARLEQNRVVFHASAKKQDADQMIVDLALELSPASIAIDAPLSLPGVYRSLSGFDNFHYRQCDLALKAMSPMFLGGLTARAMKLSAGLSQVPFVEVYPVNTGKRLGLEQWGYRSKAVQMDPILEELASMTGWSVEAAGMTGHHLDALLALYTGHLQAAGKARVAGNPAEGLIYY